VKVRRRILGLAALAVLVWLACLPGSLFAGSAFTQQDAVFSAVAMEHLQDAILHGANWRSPPFAWPLPDAITQADWMLGPAVVTLPLRILGVPAWYQYTAAVMLGLWVSCAAMKGVGERLLGDGTASWFVAVIGGLDVSAMLHAQHVNLVFHGVPWLGILAAGVGLADGRPGLAALGGVVLGLSFHFGFYIGLHGLLVAGILASVAAFYLIGSRTTWLAAFLGLAAALATMIPVVLVYRAAFTTQYGAIRLDELHGESMDPLRILAPILESPAHWPLTRIWPGPPRPELDPPNPGYVVTILALLGVWRTWRTNRRLLVACVAVAAAGALLALGPDLILADHPTLPTPYRLLLALPGVPGLRAPSRWLEVVWPAVAVLAGAGAAAIPRDRRIVAAIVGALVLLELPRVASGPVSDLRPPPVYDRLADLPPGPIADPILEDGEDCTGQQRLLAVLGHHRPLTGGQFARFNPGLVAVNKVLRTWPSASAETLLRAIGTRIVVEHPPLSPHLSTVADCRILDDHRVCVLPTRPPIATSLAPSDGHAPVVAMRFSSLGSTTVQLFCGDRTEIQPAHAWEAIAALRGAATIDVFFDVPCDDPAARSDPPGDAMRAAPGTEP
jgi:hypothetical protein